MQIFDRIGGDDYEQVVFCHDRPSNLRAIVAIHSTVLGPALGGTRFYPYPTEDAAVEDVLRLARGMTYKSAAAGLDLGGGKAVILGDPATIKTEALMRAYARFVGTLGGRYITAEDVGTTQADMDLIRRETRQVTGVSRSLGGSGDPSEATAYGVLHAMKATAKRAFGDAELAGRHVAISGVGKVGYALARHLVEERARITIADVNEGALARAAKDFGAEVAPAEKIHAVDCDIYAPCAMGGALNGTTIPELRCRAVVGSANNQLATPDAATMLQQHGTVYAPDFIVNAGGVINISEELSPAGYQRERAYAAVRTVFATTTQVFETAETDGITTAAAAERLAERRMAAVAGTRHIRTFDLDRGSPR